MMRVKVLKPGETCWQVANAPRFRLIVDAADYFKALKQAMTEAERTIFLIGWDFDFRIQLTHEKTSAEWPDMLGPFMTALVMSLQMRNLAGQNFQCSKVDRTNLTDFERHRIA